MPGTGLPPVARGSQRLLPRGEAAAEGGLPQVLPDGPPAPWRAGDPLFRTESARASPPRDHRQPQGRASGGAPTAQAQDQRDLSSMEGPRETPGSGSGDPPEAGGRGSDFQALEAELLRLFGRDTSLGGPVGLALRAPGSAPRAPAVIRVLVALLDVYKRRISPLLRRACRFTPTCSEYARLALLKHGFWRGGALAARRLLRCQPLHPGGDRPAVAATAERPRTQRERIEISVESRRLFLAALLSLAVIIVVLPVPTEAGGEAPGPARGRLEAPAPGGAAPPRRRAPAPPAPGHTRRRRSPPRLGRPARRRPGRGAPSPWRAASARAVFTNRGAQLVSLVLKNQKAADEGGLDLVRKRAGGPYPYGLVDRGLQAHPLEPGSFFVERRARTARASSSATAARRAWPRSASASTSGPDRDHRDRAGAGRLGAWPSGPGIRNLTAEELESRFERRGAVYKAGGETEQIDAKGEAEVKACPGGACTGSGLEDTYFLAAAIPRGGPGPGGDPAHDGPGRRRAEGRFLPPPSEDELTDEQEKLPRDFRSSCEPHGRQPVVPRLLGSQGVRPARRAPHDLEDRSSFGMFGFLAGRCWSACTGSTTTWSPTTAGRSSCMTVADPPAAAAADAHQHEVDEEDAGAEPQGAGDPGPVQDQAQGQAGAAEPRDAAQDERRGDGASTRRRA